MTLELAIVLALLASAVVMFVIDKPRMDVVALIMMTLLALTGIVTPKETLAGFGSPNVFLIASLFVVGEGIVRTGIAHQIGRWLVLKSGNSETMLVVLLMVSGALFSSFMSSTGVVAMFVPVVMSVCNRLKIHPSRLLMTLSAGCLIGGMLTLVGTPPNLVVDTALKDAGYEGLHFFYFTPIGLAILVLGIGYMLIARNWVGTSSESSNHSLEGERGLKNFISDYKLDDRSYRIKLNPTSPLLGFLLRDLNLRRRFGINLIGIERQHRRGSEIVVPHPQTKIRENDILLIDLCHSGIESDQLVHELHAELLPLEGPYFTEQSKHVGMAELSILPNSNLVGKTVVSQEFRNHFSLSVVGVRRGGDVLVEPIADIVLRTGDVLLVVGSWKAIHRLTEAHRDVLLFALPAEIEDVAPLADKAPYAVASVAIMVLLMIYPGVNNAIASLIGCLLLGLFGCVTIERAYRSIDWKSVVVIVGMMPFAVALEKTGAIDMGVNSLIGLTGDQNTLALIACLFFVTTFFSLFISNTATTVLMAPIAITISQQLDTSPYPFVMAVAIAASTAFMTPVASPVNMLVVGPGEYKFFDFVKVGAPFTLLVFILCVVLIPLIY